MSDRAPNLESEQSGLTTESLCLTFSGTRKKSTITCVPRESIVWAGSCLATSI